MNINKEQIGKLVLGGLGLVLTVASSIVSNKNQERALNETVTKKVAEALAKTEES